MKRILMFVTLLALALSYSADVEAQGFLKNLGKKLVEKAKDKVEQKVEEKADKAMDSVLDGVLEGNSEGEVEAEESDEIVTKKSKKSDADEIEIGETDPATATVSDFKRGDVIMFEDDFKGEQLGEFPSKWDLIEGNAEIKTIGGVKAVEITNGGIITPLIIEQGAYLPEEFTIEYEFYYWNQKDDVGLNDIKLVLANTTDRNANPLSPTDHAFSLVHSVCADYQHHYEYNNGSLSEVKSTGFEYKFKQGWHKIAISFNKRALKAYIDGNRVVNLPRVQQPTWFCFQVPYDYENLTFVRNVVLAKGAVELYDRNAQDMSAVEKAIAETGKFVTNNILFETGKATLKPESMEEIQKVAEYMKKNPTARFEVQGHTDNQGSDKINDPLSQERAEAVVKALEGQGVDPFNLRPIGKGSHEPVADNSTEAGRAQNRRVEFIKK